MTEKNAVPEIDLEKCTGCGTCAAKCPVHAVVLIEGKAVIVDPEGCYYCTDCEEVCPAAAIRCPFEIILVDPEGDLASGVK